MAHQSAGNFALSMVSFIACDVSEAFHNSASSFADKMASIDEEEEEGEIDITENPKTTESLKIWNKFGRMPLNTVYEPTREEGEVQPFQSESTLIDADIGGSRDEVYTSFKSRIANLLGKPKSEKGAEKKALEKKAKEEHRDKSPSLLKRIGKLGTKFGQMNLFQADSTATLKSGRSTDFKPLDGNFSEAKFIQKSKKSFESKYKMLRELGAGGHSTVYLARNLQDNTLAVCKFIKDSSVWKWYKDVEESMHIPYEIQVMRIFNKQELPKSVEYIGHYHLGSGKYVIVMEYLGEEWCDLYDYIENHGPVREDHAKEIFEQVVKSVEYMHWLGFLHNDIKDENIMINTRTRQLKLIDFGSCTPLVPGKRASLFYGTKKFAAPEAILNETYDPSAQEVWALGTLLYVILFKMDPFKTDDDILEANMPQKIQRLRAGGYEDISISDESVDAMLAMLEKDPLSRISIDQIKNLAFLKS